MQLWLNDPPKMVYRSTIDWEAKEVFMLYQKHFIDLENIEDEREIAARKEISNVVLKFYEVFLVGLTKCHWVNMYTPMEPTGLELIFLP